MQDTATPAPPVSPCQGCDHAGDTNRAQISSPECVIAKRAPQGCLVQRGPATDHSHHCQRSQRLGRRRVAESQTTLAPCPVCSEAPWHPGDRTHLWQGTARGWGFPFLAAWLAGTGHTAGQRPAALGGHGARSKPGKVPPRQIRACSSFSFSNRIICMLVYLGLFALEVPAVACHGHGSHAQQGEDAAAWESKATPACPDNPAPDRENTELSLPQGTAHPGQALGPPGPLQGHQ